MAKMKKREAKPLERVGNWYNIPFKRQAKRNHVKNFKRKFISSIMKEKKEKSEEKNEKEKLK